MLTSAFYTPSKTTWVNRVLEDTSTIQIGDALKHYVLYDSRRDLIFLGTSIPRNVFV